MNRLVIGLVIVAVCFAGSNFYLQKLQAQNQEERARQDADKRALAAAQQAEEARQKAVQAERAALQNARAKAAPSEFASTTIDIGAVVGDIKKSVQFYTEAIGFKEVKGFEVSGEFVKEIGLTDGAGLKIHKVVLGEGPGATTLKLMQISEAKPKKNDNEFISSQLGFRYLTIVVTDMNAALARLEKAGVKPIGMTPKALPEALGKGIWITVVRDPDGNVVELVGPKK